jgi:hypothetical protein
MAQRVKGDLYFELDGQLVEIKRQLRQSNGYPFDPKLLRAHLQAGIEGRFADLLPFPEENVEFELTLDGDATDPLAMIRADGYDDDWVFHGHEVSGKQTGQYKLVRAGYQPNLDAVKAKLGSLGDGRLSEAFRRKFLPAPGALVGFGGSEWTRSIDERVFPCLDGRGGAWGSSFRWADRGLGEVWLWLVPSK